MIKTFLFSLLVITAIGCKNSEKQTLQITQVKLNGFYEQQGEGEIIEFNDSLVLLYNSSSFNCYPYGKIPRKDFTLYFPEVKIIDKHTFTNKEGYTILTYKKLIVEPTICSDLTDEQINSNTYNFETLWNTFNDQYAFFKERNIDWSVLKTKYQSQFTDKTSAFDFYLLMKKMVLELEDDHSDIEVPDEFDELWHDLNKTEDTTDYRNLAKNKITKNFITDVQNYNGGQIVWGTIEKNIAYIQLNGMDGLADYKAVNADEYWNNANESDDYDLDLIAGTHKIASKIVNEIQNTEICIIDLRFNSGGQDEVGLAFMSHFIDKEYEVFKKKRVFKGSFSDYQVIAIKPSKPNYLKQVFILTSPYTVSAAETAIIASMNFPNVTLIGDNTVGALSDMLYKQLPNGWIYSLSNEVYETMDGKLFEVTGIPPDYVIRYPREESELFKAMNLEFKTHDRAIEKVKELLK